MLKFVINEMGPYSQSLIALDSLSVSVLFLYLSVEIMYS
jgi:hypothetical protein